MKYVTHYCILVLTALNLSSLSAAQIKVLSNNQGINSLGVEIFLDKDPSGEAAPNYQLDENIKIGIRSLASGYLYLFHLNSQGKVAQVFPNRYDQNNFLRSKETIYIPNSRYNLSVSGPEGISYIIAIASKYRLDRHKVTFADYFDGYKPKHSPASFWTTDVVRFWLGRHYSTAITAAIVPTVPTTDTSVSNVLSTTQPPVPATATTPNTPNQITSSQAAVENTNQAPNQTPTDGYQSYTSQHPYSKWQTANIKDYSFIFKQECFCTDEYLKAMYVIVRNNKVDSVTYAGNNQAVPKEVFNSVLTLGELLEGTSKVEKNDLSKVEGEYDRDLGFPKKLFIDNDINDTNDEVFYEVSFFRVE